MGKAYKFVIKQSILSQSVYSNTHARIVIHIKCDLRSIAFFQISYELFR